MARRALMLSLLTLSCAHPAAKHPIAAAPVVIDPDGPLRTRELDVPRGYSFRLHVRVVGDPHAGPPIVIMPGGPGLSYQYLAALERLATPARAVVSFDTRGSGQSTAPPTDSWTLADFANDVEAVRLALGADKIHLVGHSYSGLYAMAYAVAHPDHLASLILVDSIPARAQDMDAAMERFFERKDELAAQGVVPKTFPSYEDDDCMAALLTWAPVWYADPSKFARSQFAGTTCTDVDAETSAGVGNYDLTAGLGELRVPTLVVAPAGTPFGTGMADSVAGALTHGARKVVLPDCGHLPWFECPEPFFAAMAGFLADPRNTDP
jgi:proline iminopeptidase